jgi:hypothetical protein
VKDVIAEIRPELGEVTTDSVPFNFVSCSFLLLQFCTAGRIVLPLSLRKPSCHRYSVLNSSKHVFMK